MSLGKSKKKPWNNENEIFNLIDNKNKIISS